MISNLSIGIFKSCEKTLAPIMCFEREEDAIAFKLKFGV